MCVKNFVHSGGVCPIACWNRHPPGRHTPSRDGHIVAPIATHKMIQKPELCLLPPANEVCKGYVFTRVYQSFCSQGGGYASVHARIAVPPGAAPSPQEHTPPISRPLPSADTSPLEKTPPWAVNAGRYSQQVGGAHPTGIHTCFAKKSLHNTYFVSFLIGVFP